jgi:hypothetical protein
MYGAVRALGNQLADVTGTLPRIAQLLALILVGAVTYALVLAALWVLSGRPHSAERSLLDRTRAIARRIAGFGFSRSVGNPS